MASARFERLRETSTLNGIDFVEATDDGMMLVVRFVRDLRLADLTAADFTIAGGERIRDVGPLTVSPGDRPDELKVGVARRGDFSAYVLRVAPLDAGLDAIFDPVFREAGFLFRAACPSEFDCRDGRERPEPTLDEPPLDYLARDYATFRRLMLDRMSTLAPEWRERNPADPGVALVEAMAYVADRLAYRQDAIATEAYLGTARSRISVRRHARLVDYAMHDGRNARTFVRMQVGADATTLLPPKGTPTFVRTEGLARQVDPTTVGPDVPAFETMETPRGLFVAHNRVVVHDWGIEEATIPKGATKATLKGPLPDLQAGDWIMLVEARGPTTGDPEDADPQKRHPVRLTEVTPALDPLATSASVVEVAWHAEDALPFALCLSHRVETDDGSRLVEGIAEAWGNLVLADHGRTLAGTVYDPSKAVPFTDVTQASDLEPGASAASALRPKGAAMPQSIPQLGLTDGDGLPWSARRDLLASGPDASDFVLEVDDRSLGHLRFGDGVNGRRPTGAYDVVVRQGNGAAGNVAAGALFHLGRIDARIVEVGNPLPAEGGEAPESSERVRQTAPFAFRTNRRAVTEADYAHYAGLAPGVQRAAARFRWTGSWRTVFVLVDRTGGLPIDEAFAEAMLDYLEPYRMAGHDLEIRGPNVVPLEIAVEVCARPDRFKEDVAREVRRALMPFFDADRLTFGQAVRLSPLVAAAQAVPGVDHVRVVTFQRQNAPDGAPLANGYLALEPLEIARLDDDPDFPERGRLTVTVEGGR